MGKIIGSCPHFFHFLVFLDYVNLLVRFSIGAVGRKISGDGIKLLIEYFYLGIYEFDLFT